MRETLESDGYVLLAGVFRAAECDELMADWAQASSAPGSGIMRSESGAIYGARNILDLWPGAARLACQPLLHQALISLVGPTVGLVRGLFFDKPPGDSWALPWHKDLAIAVRDNQGQSTHFSRPTLKYGVPHVEAPKWLLERMLTARIHFDDVTDENGPLRVMSGSHRQHAGHEGCRECRILCQRGDVLLMRPLLSHASGHSRPETSRHRRIVHLEFSPDRALPDGYEWHTFLPVG